MAESVTGRRILKEDTGDSGFGTYGGGLVDTSGYIYDDPNFAYGWPSSIFSTLADRQFGLFWPIYRSEMDLMRIRGSVHNLRLLANIDGPLDSLANYVLGKGFTFEALESEASKNLGDFGSLISAVQRVVDEFVDEHGFDGSGLDREAHQRSREDGEAFIPVEWSAKKSRVKCRFLECEQITQPANHERLDDWLGFGMQFPSDWTFGIHTTHRRTNEVHAATTSFTTASRARSATFPTRRCPPVCNRKPATADLAPVSRLQHIKRNVTGNAKRGVTDFFSVMGDLAREAKLRRNTAEGAALQAG